MANLDKDIEEKILAIVEKYRKRRHKTFKLFNN